MATTVLFDWGGTLGSIRIFYRDAFWKEMNKIDPEGTFFGILTNGSWGEASDSMQEHIERHREVVGIVGDAEKDIFYQPNRALHGVARMEERAFCAVLAAGPIVLVDDAPQKAGGKLKGLETLLGSHGLKLPRVEVCRFDEREAREVNDEPNLAYFRQLVGTIQASRELMRMEAGVFSGTEAKREGLIA